MKNTGGLHAFGICIALLSAIALMSWTQATRTVHNYTPEPFVEDEIITISATANIVRKEKPIPPPQKENMIIEEVEDLEEIQEPEIIPLDVPVYAIVETSDIASDFPSLPAPEPVQIKPAEKTIEVEEIVSIAERMPIFPGCFSEDLNSKEQAKCTEAELMNYVFSNLQYPSIAKANNIKGRVILQFVVNTNGELSDIKVVRDIGGGCGAAAIKIVENMVGKKGLWTPGKQRNRKVNVRYTLPIVFALEK